VGSYTSEVLGVVGAVIGGVWGGGNWQAGYLIGSAIGGVIEGPVKIPAPGLSEAPVQTSRDGVPIPIVWGLHQVHGNILQKNPETQITRTTSSGKGGGTETSEKRRLRTFAIGICAAPIHEVTRIWENGRLVYDIRETPTIPEAETAKYAQGLRFYNGDETQLPDSELEAHWGADSTPAYRGLAYIVWVNKDLTDFGGAIPQYAFEVNGSNAYSVTSKPYPIEVIEGIDPTVGAVDKYIWTIPREGIDPSITPQDGTLRALINTYSVPVEGLETAITPQDGTLRDLIEEYTIPVEGIEAAITPQDGTLEVLVFEHTYGAEGITPAITPKNGVLA
jgi:hypothetical protein